VLVFLLDAATLAVVFPLTWHCRAAHDGVHRFYNRIYSGTVSFMPGGIGGFEAGAIGTLTLLGIPIEAASQGRSFCGA